MKTEIDGELVIECSYCQKPFDTEASYYDLEPVHKDHVEFVWHDLDPSICQTCEGDEPVHCQAFMESAIDFAKESNE